MSFRSKNWLLGGGFSAIIILMVLFAAVSFLKARSLAQLTNDMYNHPLAVSNAVLEANSGIISMHRYMKDIPLSQNNDEMELAISHVREAEHEVNRKFGIIMDKYLGDKSQIIDALSTFRDWGSIRMEVITLMRSGNRDGAALITKDKGAKHVKLLAQKMDGLIRFARNKAYEFHQDSNRAFQSIKYLTGWLLFISILISGIVAAFVISVISRADSQLNQAKDDLQKANETLENRVKERTRELYNESIDRKYAEEILNRFFDQSTHLNMITDLTGKIIRTNNSWQKTLGYLAKDLEGRSIFDFIHPLDVEHAQKAITQPNAKKESFSFDTRFIHKKGEFRLLSWSAKESPKDNTIFAVAVDTTESKETETALQLAKLNAEKSSQAKSDFLASMSHDLRTPLNAIMGFSDMMRLEAFGALGDDHYKEYANDIHDSGALLISLINDILDLSKVEAGKYDLTDQQLDLDALINSSFRQLETMALKSNITLTFANNLNGAFLLADERILIQIFNNLLSNAIKFSQKDGTINVTGQINETDCITISIVDQGIGMSKEDLAKALLPFEQAGESVSRKHQGTGLGLHLCINFMELLGGTLDVESEPDQGTTVVLTFPAARTIKNKT